MSRKKLAAIIVPSIIAIVVVIVITTHLPQKTIEPEQTAVSAYNLSEQLFDPELTSFQKDTLWKEYEGKQVKWTSELKEVASGKEGTVAYFLNPLDSGRSEIKAVFDISQSSNSSQCRKGDLVTYTGILTSFEESLGDAEICLGDCALVSLALESLWWNSELRGTYSYFEYIKRSGSIYIHVDSDYIYVYVFTGFTIIAGPYGYLPLRGSRNLTAIDRASGQIAHTLSSESGELWFPLKDLPTWVYEYAGVIYKGACAVYGGEGTNCGTLQAIDEETGDVIWMMTFQETGMNDFFIADGILYVSTDNGVGAFRLPNVTNP